MHVSVPVVDEVVGRTVVSIDGPVRAVSGNYAVQGGVVKRCWMERGHVYYKLEDRVTKSKLPSYFPASGFKFA